MIKRRKVVLSLVVLVAIGVVGLKGFLWYYDQGNSYVRLEGKDENAQLIEYKPS